MQPASHHSSPTRAASLHNQHGYELCNILNASYPCPIMTSTLGVVVFARRWDAAHSTVVPQPPTVTCYAEKATPARHRPERQHNARSNRRKQCSPNETIPYPNPKPPRKRQTTVTCRSYKRVKGRSLRAVHLRNRIFAAPSDCHGYGMHAVAVCMFAK